MRFWLASYLVLALRRRLPLATLDVELLAAMRRAGVPPAVLPTVRPTVLPK